MEDMSEQPNQRLSVWHLDSAYRVVALSADDACAAYRESTGDDAISDREDDGESMWERCDDGEVLAIIDDVELEPEQQTTTTKTCGEWAAINGRGFLCSTEW